MPLDGVGECEFTGGSFERWYRRWRGWRRRKRQGIGQELDGAWCSRTKVCFVTCFVTSRIDIGIASPCNEGLFTSFFLSPICPSFLLTHFRPLLSVAMVKVLFVRRPLPSRDLTPGANCLKRVATATLPESKSSSTLPTLMPKVNISKDLEILDSLAVLATSASCG